MGKYSQQLIQTLLKFNKTHELQEFLNAILTPQELEMIPKRLEIIRSLKNGIDQRSIATKLGVGIATVTRGSKEIKIHNKIWEKAIS